MSNQEMMPAVALSGTTTIVDGWGLCANAFQEMDYKVRNRSRWAGFGAQTMEKNSFARSLMMVLDFVEYLDLRIESTGWKTQEALINKGSAGSRYRNCSLFRQLPKHFTLPKTLSRWRRRGASWAARRRELRSYKGHGVFSEMRNNLLG